VTGTALNTATNVTLYELSTTAANDVDVTAFKIERGTDDARIVFDEGEDTWKLDKGAGAGLVNIPTGGRYSLTDGATIAVDWNNGDVQSVTLGGNRTFTFSNGQDGGKYTLIIKQDGTGTRTITWPASVRWPGGTALTLTTSASKTDYIGFIYNGVDSKYDGVACRFNY